MAQIHKSDGARRLRSLLTRDYTPWANRYVYWLKTPLGALIAAAAAALLVGWLVTPQGFVIFGAVAGVLAIGVSWPWVGLRGIACTIRFPQTRCEEGELVPVAVEIANRWPFPVWGLAIERGFFRTADAEQAAVVALSRIPGWSTCRFSFEFRPELRGVYPAGAPIIATEFPFGLWKARRESEVVESLVVWPRVLPLASLDLPAGNCRHLVGASDARSGDHGDRTGARPYRQGDSLRNVHWAQTARCDRLIVSERQESAQTAARVVIDCCATHHRGAGPSSTLEWAIRIGVSVAAALAKQNVQVTVELGKQTCSLDGSLTSRRRMLDAAARLEPVAATTQTDGARGALNIVVRTDLTPPLPGESRAIVINVAAETGAGRRGNWIEVDAGDSIATEFSRAWQRQRT
ncbi:DUF58 domain-containing protein [Blastopirellula marina]|uniref:DUF58 domain-containing protein n=1 Tax=Blastopirellula marina TaxID=124 RepID=A0A2S8GQJ6_9BACT|nr:DUF58 domain-containing protein [Blastopirellula marina]PQO46709.1 hypothetical protein C5Y93_07700 [Blastopirellula marina]